MRTDISPTPSSAADGNAAALRALHVPGTPLMLPNAWDAASAQAVEAAGFPAVATGSVAVAASLGYSDGEDAPVDEMLAAVGRIVRVVSVPVTADLERGYGMPPAELVERLLATGAVGCNLEDSDPRTGEMVDVAKQADFLAEVRAAAGNAGADLVINARIDTYLRGGSAEPVTRLAETIDRARAYRSAGADCVYPIFLKDRESLRTLVREGGGPVNALFLPGTPALSEFAELGVARLSFGPGLYKSAQKYVSRMLQSVHAGQDPYAPGASGQ